MRQVVWKYPLDWSAEPQEVEVPIGARCVTVGIQGEAHGVGTLTTWWLVENPTEVGKTVRRFVVRGTGHEVEGEARYLGTTGRDGFVWHVFELLEGRPVEPGVDVPL